MKGLSCAENRKKPEEALPEWLCEQLCCAQENSYAQ